MGRRVVLVGVALAIVAGVVVLRITLPTREFRRSTDPAFVLLESEPSPDGLHTRLTYKFDNGATGYSCVWWAVVPADHAGVNLVAYELPAGFRATGWTGSGSLIVEAWDPYYSHDRRVELKSGGTVHGVPILIPERVATASTPGDSP